MEFPQIAKHVVELVKKYQEEQEAELERMQKQLQQQNQQLDSKLKQTEEKLKDVVEKIRLSTTKQHLQKSPTISAGTASPGQPARAALTKQPSLRESNTTPFAPKKPMEPAIPEAETQPPAAPTPAAAPASAEVPFGVSLTPLLKSLDEALTDLNNEIQSCTKAKTPLKKDFGMDIIKVCSQS